LAAAPQSVLSTGMPQKHYYLQWFRARVLCTTTHFQLLYYCLLC